MFQLTGKNIIHVNHTDMDVQEHISRCRILYNDDKKL